MNTYTFQHRREQRFEFEIVARDEEEATRLAEAHLLDTDRATMDDTSDDKGELEIIQEDEVLPDHCVLSGDPSESADDCGSHEHEYDLSQLTVPAGHARFEVEVMQMMRETSTRTVIAKNEEEAQELALAMDGDAAEWVPDNEYCSGEAMVGSPVRVEEVSIAQDEFVSLMHGLSQEHFSAGWMSDWEFTAWALLVGDPLSSTFQLPDEQLEQLRVRSRGIGGWCYWPEEGTHLDAKFIPMDQWLPLYIAHRSKDNS